MADDDNFDIDIYGDDAAPEFQDNNCQGEAKQDDASAMHTDSPVPQGEDARTKVKTEQTDGQARQDSSTTEPANGEQGHENGSTQQIASTGGANNTGPLHKQAPQQQGMKRKQGDQDDRPTDPGATNALMINDLHWWISEEDIRGWANQSGCEDEVIEVTFNEHKVNGKSKGQVYVLLQSPQAATALRHQIDAAYKDQAHAKKPTAIFNAPHVNPFKTLPKDAPVRDKNRDGGRGNYSGGGGGQGGSFNRFNNRGNFNSNRGGAGFQNRNFSGPVGGNMGGPMGGFGGPGPMNNFNPMGGMGNFNPGFNRGGMMGGGMRGGMGNRGGRGAGGMGMGGGMGGMPGGMGMPMGGNMMGMMGAGSMPMGGNMGMMGGMGGPGFGGNQGHFNPAFFPGQSPGAGAGSGGGGDGNWNPHGAKRPRPE